MKLKNLVHRLACIVLLAAYWSQAVGADLSIDKDIVVQVQKNGETIVVDVSFSVAATPQEAWSVLTDFDGMSGFISNLQSSRVIGRNGNKLQVSQIGKAARGAVMFTFESIREIELTPFNKIKTRLISGNLKQMDGTTLLTLEPGGTRVDYHGESIPSVWVPPVIGIKFIEHEVEEQFHEIRDEILRRKSAAPRRL